MFMSQNRFSLILSNIQSYNLIEAVTKITMTMIKLMNTIFFSTFVKIKG